MQLLGVTFRSRTYDGRWEYIMELRSTLQQRVIHLVMSFIIRIHLVYNSLGRSSDHREQGASIAMPPTTERAVTYTVAIAMNVTVHASGHKVQSQIGKRLYGLDSWVDHTPSTTTNRP